MGVKNNNLKEAEKDISEDNIRADVIGLEDSLFKKQLNCDG